jgi:hypothetical protein
LDEHIEELTDNFDTITRMSLTSDDHEVLDSRMYQGSSGVIYGLFKAFLLFKKEADDGGDQVELEDIKRYLDEAFDENHDVVDELQAADGEGVDCPSFYGSLSAGLASV